MAGGPKPASILLTAERCTTLQRLVQRRGTTQASVMRARIVLAADAEPQMTNKAIAAQLRVSRESVITWRQRLLAYRLDGLVDAPRGGAPRRVGDEAVERMITFTLEEQSMGATHWSTRDIARKVGMSQTMVSRVWRAFGLQPHRSKTFKLSRDPAFIDKVRNVVGLTLNLPERALVLCVEEELQIQAIEETAPILPIRPGQIEQSNHDYKRHGTTDMSAALGMKADTVIGACKERHHSTEFRAFLDQVEAAVPTDLDVHCVTDNAATHKTRVIHDWLLKQPATYITDASILSSKLGFLFHGCR